MKGELTWRTLTAMHSLYERSKVTSNRMKDDMFKHLRRRRLVTYQPGNQNYILKEEGYDAYFVKHYLQDYLEFQQFLQSIDPELSGRRTYTVNDIRSLRLVAVNKKQIRNELTTRNTFSEQFFEHGGAKHLESHPGLNKLVLSILEVDDYPLDDPKLFQWRFVVDVNDPRCIVLCENLNFLKIPRVAIENKIELWYVGGNNTKSLPFINEAKLNKPLFYSCDWDHKGLEIYQRIKKIFREKGYDIHLLYPSTPIQRHSVKMKKHKSKWNPALPLSGLNPDTFNEKERLLINELITKDQWIEEESNDLVGMVNYQGSIIA